MIFGGLRYVLLVAVLLTVATAVQATSARTDVIQGNRLYGKSRFEDSLRHYEAALKKNPESDIIHFNAGTALYKNGRYADSVGHLEKALLSDDPSLHRMAQYNLGSALYKFGIAQEEKDLAKAVASLEKSVQHLGRAINLDKTDEDAQYNYDFVKQELERLLKKQQQQTQHQSGQGQKEDKETSSDNARRDSPEDQSPGPSKKEDGQESPDQRQGQEEKAQSQQSQNEQGQGQDQQAGQSASSSPASQDKKTDMPTPHGQELTPSEAKRLLEHYQEREEPRGLFKAVQEKIDINDVSKDW